MGKAPLPHNKGNCYPPYRDHYLNMNEQHVTLLVLLDLTPAFDTVKYTILVEALGKLGIGGKVLEWFRSYLSGRAMRMFVRGWQSGRFELSRLLQ